MCPITRFLLQRIAKLGARPQRRRTLRQFSADHSSACQVPAKANKKAEEGGTRFAKSGWDCKKQSLPIVQSVLFDARGSRFRFRVGAAQLCPQS